MKDDQLNYLRIPLYKLNFIKNVDEFEGLKDWELSLLPNEYEPEEITSIFSALEWAKENPDFDFLSLSPELKHSSDEIYVYLCKVHASMASIMQTPNPGDQSA
ncbi:MAG: hypothetical protein WED00_18805 [Aquisalimonadaceae bacterium]